MRRRPPRSTRPDTLFPYTTLFRSFIWANMPLGKPYSLTEQEAWDVAAFINSHERPKDTRQTGTVAEALEKYHEGEQSYYGKVRSEEHTSELQSLMRISYAVFCLKKKNNHLNIKIK